eukprot:TRINITY_DN48_c0_g1_i1.p1 TRINITY_DN48_c0_g1~~TRINITY_DN48_c0_g1_i1.p1  ORF type:complete len:989 (+),score=284.89 TRINITY_DN48_c0_g1_i1:141-3107(+)
MCIRDRYQRRVRGESSQAMLLSARGAILLLACAVYGAHLTPEATGDMLTQELPVVSDSSDLVAELGESAKMSTFLGRPEMTLGEIQAVASGSRMLSSAGMRHFKKSFVQLAEKIKSSSLKQSALMLAQTSTAQLMSSGKERKGLALIFKKLAGLEAKVKEEGVDDTQYISDERDKCSANIQAASAIITTANEKKNQNDIQIRTDHAAMTKARQDHRDSRRSEGQVQNEFSDMEEERTDTKSGFAQRIDERNKAIDVMIKATFIVCEKFNRFKGTEQCKSIKSRPDVNEPGVKVFPPAASENLPPAWRNASDIDADKAATKAYEEGQAEAWAALLESDASLQGNPNPEGLPMHSADGEGGVVNEKTMSRDQMQLAEDDSLPDRRLDHSEKPGLIALKQLATHANRARLDSRYSLPITELAIAVSKGKSRKAKNIVQILLDVIKITEEEQKKDKEDLVLQLDSFYARAWDMRSSMSSEASKQEELRNLIDAANSRMQITLQDTEEQLQAMKTQLQVRTLEEDRCEQENEEYGVREAVRVEDLENLVKLTSLLRALYDKIEPLGCPKGEGDAVQCTNKDNGWCVFTDKQSNDQRCSCNTGFYGNQCEKKMCPGSGQALYMSKDADGQRNPGVCSSHGNCDSDTGTCAKCDEGFYHGDKQACELKHCPVSLGGALDEKCSGHGTCDTKRGTCACQEGWSGPGCENKSCPNSNGVLYPFDSSNACNGRGACDVKSGQCACSQPYYGDACEKSNCPEDCLGLGGCNAQTGKCACPQGRFGGSCEFTSCPRECNAPSNGECNRLTGKCVCKMGFIGQACDVSTRCDAPALAVQEQNWYTTWDKPGWATCPPGQLMYGLKRSSCESLACVEAARCAAPCEGAGEAGKPLEVRHCYHALDWYGSFDKEGWSKCDPNYALAGLYRSCDSLYCLQMAKCCSFKDTRWAQCEETNWYAKFNAAGWVSAPKNKFIAGFYRGAEHKLAALDKAWSCGLVQGY